MSPDSKRRWSLNRIRESWADEAVKYAFGGALTLVTLLGLWLWPTIKVLIFTTSFEFRGWQILAGAIVAASLPYALSWYWARSRSDPAYDLQPQFKPIDIIMPGLEGQTTLLWRVKRPPPEWIDVNTDFASSYITSILDGPYCGRERESGKYCRELLNTPPKSGYDTGCQSHLSCHRCDGTSGETYPTKAVKLEAVRALQRYAHNGGTIRDKVVVPLV